MTELLIFIIESRVLGNITTKVCDIDLTREIPLEAREQDLSLARLKPIAKTWNVPETVNLIELYKFVVDEVLVPELLLQMVNLVMH